MNLDRLLIEKLENRILVGIAAFVGTMIIIGWITINEPARMATFADQFEGRSIERGGKLFSANCSTCHGPDGRGLVGIAPGLNSPHLFGYSFTAGIERQIDALNRELEAEDTTEERVAEIEAEIAELQSERDALIAQMQPAIDAGYTPDTPERTDQVGWEGSLRSYVYTTLVHGRPGSNNYWPSGNGMAAWGQTSGGPMRADQLEDVTSYIMNWDKGDAWTIDDLNAVQQYAIVAAPEGSGGSDGEPTVGEDVDAILTELENYTGDPINGQQLYASYACQGCHAGGAAAPATEAQWGYAVAGTDGRPYAGEPERYIIESIVQPNAYIVSGYQANVMPQNFADRITYQEMADLLAYVSSFDS